MDDLSNNPGVKENQFFNVKKFLDFNYLVELEDNCETLNYQDSDSRLGG